MADNNITLFTEDRPGYYELSSIYDPDTTYEPGVTKIIPKVQSLVIDTSGRLYYVTAVSTTYKSTLKPASILVTDDEEGDQISIVSYGNDIFYIYMDNRSLPIRLQPDRKLFIRGNVENYKLIINKDESNEKIVSRYYDTDGNYVGNMVPMVPVLTDTGDNSGIYYCTACHTLDTITVGTKITLEVYNSYGALVASVTTFARESAIANEALGYRPVITELKVTSTQMRENGELFIYEKQSVNSLNIQPVLVYDDGTEVEVSIDNEKCFIYGLEEFVASWQGLRQTVMIKYYLNHDELVEEGITDVSFITKEIDIVVIPNEVGAGIKLSVIPYWSTATNAYVLRYFMYTTDRNSIRDVTTHVTITNGTFIGTLYSSYQTFTVQVDMSDIDPTTYTESIYHNQVITIKLQPIAALEKYLIKDATLTNVIYGIDSSTSRRPVMYYDSDLEKYFIPSSIFTNVEAFINSFYTKACPPYDVITEEEPIEPTHFVLRSTTGTMLVADRIAIADYDAAFSITGTPKSRLVDTTVVVEFLHVTESSTVLILYGVPVDVSLSESGYIG